MNDRFEQLKEHNNNFSFLYNMKKFKKCSHEELLKHCKDLHILLTDGDSTNINGIEMADELKSVSAMVDDNLTPYELLTFVVNAGDFAPNLYCLTNIVNVTSISGNW